MIYQTSFYMHIRNYVKLAKASQRTGITMHDLIVQIMYQYAMNHKKMQVAKGTVQYQNVDKRSRWRIFRIALDEKNYELFTDMRKVMKKSVSLLVALAIKKYLDKIITQIFKKSFSYTYFKHESLGHRVFDFIYWLLTWKFDKQRNTKSPPNEPYGQ